MLSRQNKGALLSAVTVGATLLLVACSPKYPKCEKDKDCHEDEFCVNGLCQQCRSDADCAASESCNQGRCDAIAAYCESNADCGPGQACRGNRCVTVATAAPKQFSGAETDSSCALATVYFEFDSDILGSGSRRTLQSNADCVQSRGIDKVHVTGHTDPRGTEEYNFALADRRARSVVDYLSTLGMSQDALSASSMGEEMATGEDESGWAQDRKVEFTEQ